MFSLMKLFNKNSETNSLSREEIIQMLKTSPDALDRFEKYYQKDVLPNLPADNNIFTKNAKEAIAETKISAISNTEIQNMIHRIADELLIQTPTFVYDGVKAQYRSPELNGERLLTDHINPVTINEIKTLPEGVRPQLTGTLMQKNITDEFGLNLLYYYKRMFDTKSEKLKRNWYHLFRHGLDIFDLDPIIYHMLSQNANTMSKWLPPLIQANKKHGFFQIPKTIIAKVPMTLLQLTRIEFETITPTTKAIVDEWAMRIFDLKTDKDYFLKTGTYSSKFDFRNCHVNDPKEITEIGEYLLYIHFQALQMAGLLSRPSIYGVSTTNEWVVREYIPDKENNPVIYKGLPLHTEYRIFIDCDKNSVLGILPYWQPDVMKRRFEEHRDGHDEHDAITYRVHEQTLMTRYEQNKERVTEEVEKLLPNLDLSGQWSLDIMQNGNDFWLIDMALAENSAGYDTAVPKEKRRPTAEDWLPKIPV